MLLSKVIRIMEELENKENLSNIEKKTREREKMREVTRSRGKPRRTTPN